MATFYVKTQSAHAKPKLDFEQACRIARELTQAINSGVWDNVPLSVAAKLERAWQVVRRHEPQSIMELAMKAEVVAAGFTDGDSITVLFNDISRVKAVSHTEQRV